MQMKPKAPAQTIAQYYEERMKKRQCADDDHAPGRKRGADGVGDEIASS
jgi:hypothetical protein